MFLMSGRDKEDYLIKMQAELQSKYRVAEPSFQSLNYFVTLNLEDIKQRNEELKEVIHDIITLMQETDPLFNKLYERLEYVGSFYDGLKIEKPTEFDLNLVLNYPFSYRDLQLISTRGPPGFVKVLDRNQDITNFTNGFMLRTVFSWFSNNHYLLANKVRQWMISVIQTALNKYKACKSNNFFQIKISTSGPAITLNITNRYSEPFDVDLVPVFQFKYPFWPPKPCRTLLPKELDRCKTWYIVPKPLRKFTIVDAPNLELYWRLSFQEQEKVLIRNKNALKPALRILKKFRNTHNFNLLSSYYLKTIFLWEAETREEAFWNSPVSEIFMYMLSKLRDYFKKKEIPFFWAKENNLIGTMNPSTIENFCNRIDNIIAKIDTRIDNDHLAIVKEILPKHEYNEFLNIYIDGIGIKQCSTNQESSCTCS